MSSSANGPIGWPHPSFIALSMSSAVAYPDSSILIASLRYGNSSALTMNPARSGQTTQCLPIFAPAAKTLSTVSSLVRTVRTTSTSFITCAG